MTNSNKILIVLLLCISTTYSLQAQAQFSGDRLRQAVVAYAEKTVGDDAEVLVSHTIADQAFQENGVSAKCLGSKESLRGVSNVAIEFSANGRIIRRIQVPIQVKIYRDVAISTSSIGYTSLINQQQFTIEKRDVTAYSDNELLTISEIIGSSARRTIPKGSIITRTSITEIGGMRRGMPVTIIVQSGNVIIRTRGAVLNDAALGETVRAMREGTNTMLTGILQENHTIYIGNLGSSLSERK